MSVALKHYISVELVNEDSWGRRIEERKTIETGHESFTIQQ